MLDFVHSVCLLHAFSSLCRVLVLVLLLQPVPTRPCHQWACIYSVKQGCVSISCCSSKLYYIGHLGYICLLAGLVHAGSLLTLQGPGAYDAAVHCASVSAARKLQQQLLQPGAPLAYTAHAVQAHRHYDATRPIPVQVGLLIVALLFLGQVLHAAPVACTATDVASYTQRMCASPCCSTAVPLVARHASPHTQTTTSETGNVTLHRQPVVTM